MSYVARKKENDVGKSSVAVVVVGSRVRLSLSVAIIMKFSYSWKASKFGE